MYFIATNVLYRGIFHKQCQQPFPLYNAKYSSKDYLLDCQQSVKKLKYHEAYVQKE